MLAINGPRAIRRAHELKHLGGRVWELGTGLGSAHRDDDPTDSLSLCKSAVQVRDRSRRLRRAGGIGRSDRRIDRDGQRADIPAAKDHEFAAPHDSTGNNILDAPSLLA